MPSAPPKDYLREQTVTAIYLDCVEGNGFLPRFYAENGYHHLDAREVRPGLTMHLFRRLLRARSE